VEGSAQTNHVYLNDTTGNFLTSVPITADLGNTRGVAVGDMDSDGDLDVVAGNLGGSPVRLYLNSGDGVEYTGTNVSSNSPAVDKVIVVDLNGDRHLDVAVATHAGYV